MTWQLIACIVLPAYACVVAVLAGVWCVYRDVRSAITHMYMRAFSSTCGSERTHGHKHAHACTHSRERPRTHTCTHVDDLASIANGTYTSRSAAVEVAERLATPTGRQQALRTFAKKTGSNIATSRIADTLIDVASAYILRDLQSN